MEITNKVLEEKTNLHQRNLHRNRYDFDQLTTSYPELAKYVFTNKYEALSIDYFDPEAVIALNKALLLQHYGIVYWELPEGYLCPPIPGRADYIHHIADLLEAIKNNFGKKGIPKGNKIRCLDIGVGANCIYPIIGSCSYGWSFVGVDSDPIAIIAANKIIENNPKLKGRIEIRSQSNIKDIFHGIINSDEYFDVTICNPPFYSSEEEALNANHRKVNNLNKHATKKYVRNFGGQANELWYNGGEAMFLETMINQSQHFSTSCFWFTTLVSKEANVSNVLKKLKKTDVQQVKVIEMNAGNKKSRIIAWTFLLPDIQKKWCELRWA